MLRREFLALGDHFPDSNLVLGEVDDAHWEISGELKVRAKYLDHNVQDEFEIQISISPDYPNKIPAVKEIGNRIPRAYHTLRDGSLCLGAPLSVLRDFHREPTLTGFFINCLVPYLYSFVFNDEFGRPPYGELSHGDKGILEYYQEVFGCSNARVIVELLTLVVEENCHCQIKCPCRSGKRIRDCHGPILCDLLQFKKHYNFHRDRSILSKYTYIPNTKHTP